MVDSYNIADGINVSNEDLDLGGQDASLTYVQYSRDLSFLDFSVSDPRNYFLAY